MTFADNKVQIPFIAQTRMKEPPSFSMPAEAKDLPEYDVIYRWAAACSRLGTPLKMDLHIQTWHQTGQFHDVDHTRCRDTSRFAK